MTEGPPIDLDSYFERIGYGGAASATLPTLQALHRLHAEAIAFENLSSFAGQSVALDSDQLQSKLVRARRGGYCFEHNSLFWQVLEQLGFEVSGLAARVLWGSAPGVRHARGHMLLRVELEGQSLIADVGFGGLTLTGPLRLTADLEQATPHEPFRLTQRESGLWQLEARLALDWTALYAFDLQRQYAVDYEIWNWWTCTHPRSIFVTELMLARPEPGVRHGLRNGTYSRHPLTGEAHTQRIETLEQLRALIRGPFNIALPEDAALDARLSALLQR